MNYTKKLTGTELVLCLLAIGASLVMYFYSKEIGLLLLLLIIAFALFISFKDPETREKVKSGGSLITDSFKAFFQFPSLAIPLIVVWLIYAPTIIYIKFFLGWSKYTYIQQALIGFLVIFLFSFILSVSCLVLLELLQQHETGKRMNLFTAFFETLTRDFIKSLPIIFTWSILWFIITLIQSIFTRKKDEDDETPDFTPENVAETLSGLDNFSLSSAYFEALKKGVRMVVFLILPAIAWEDKSTIKAIKSGLKTARSHVVELTTGFILTEAAAGLVFLPPALLFYLSKKLEMQFPDYVWITTIIYCGFAWSFAMFMEQMFSAELYMWHMKWEKEVEEAQDKGQDLPALADIKRPSIFDNVNDLEEVFKKNKLQFHRTNGLSRTRRSAAALTGKVLGAPLNRGVVLETR